MANTAVTISRSKAYNLSLQEQTRGFSHKFHVDYSDVASGTGSSDTVTMTLGALPSAWVVNNALVNITTAFAGTTAFSVQVGTTTSAAAFVTATSVKTAGVIGSPLTQALTNATATATANLVATFTNATGGSPSALTSGALDIYLNIIDLSGAGPNLG
jgi:hypothetical protein